MYPFYSLDYESPSSFEDVEDDEAIVDLGSPPKEPDHGVVIVGSCNGLICLLYLPDSFILWNPTIKESKELPTPPFSPSYGDLCFRGFGYNSSIDDYKVVRRAPSANANPNQFIVEVFSLKADSWRRIEDIKDSLVIEEGDVGSCSNGALHWLGSSVAGPNKTGVIISLDLGTEEFREIPIPDCEVNAVTRLVVDGAWDKKSWEGAVAWCSVGDGQEVRNEGRREVFASSALMAEALAVWYALAWAFDRGWLSVEICSDCLVLVQGLWKANRVHPLVRIILSDIVHFGL
ncbi:hypothetical protein RHGRI_026004 [Rhododendron griersonianum]|uniref:F-box/kelch-repeat protein n=1 Tax=Rhododendron griersonianum TaxID=479676 RepID=A0AAV6IVN2_9ERIC|nr:hypothetical protein RHGRI_026004 [Rhododendron griersonianum]